MANKQWEEDNRRYVANQLDRLKPLKTQIDEHTFNIKLTSPSGATNWLAVSYNQYFRIAKILLEKDNGTDT